MEDFLCPICLESFPLDEAVTLCQCGCSFCKNCLVLYITSVVNSHLDLQFPCPGYECRLAGKLTDTEIKNLVSTELYDRYVVRKTQRDVETNLTLTFCPAIGCGAVCDVPLSTVRRRNKRADTILKGFLVWCRKHIRCARRRHVTDSAYVPSGPTSNDQSKSSTVKSVRDIQKGFMEQNGIITPLNPAHVRQPPSTCPPVRVVCSTCHHAFCARCHMSWHENEPVPCKFCSSSRIAPSTNTTRKLKSHRFEKSLFFNRKGHGQTAESPPVRQSFGKPSTSTPGMIVSESKVVPSEETVSQPLASRSSTSTIPVDGKAEESVLLPEQVDDPRLKEKAAKKRSLASTSNTGKKLRSKLTFSNGHPTTSDNSDGSSLAVGFPPYPPDANLKRCPACLVPIERTEGCAQMMCRSCNHTFCWYCLTSLDDDFLLHHYDRGACKGKLGHSRASIIGHRIYVVSVFTGLTILLFVAAPFAIISIPCLLCAKFSRIRHQKRVRKRHSQNVFPPTSQLSVVSSTEVVKTGEQFEPNSTGHSLTLVGSVSANSYEAPGSILVAEKADIHWSDIGRTALPPGASEIPQTVTPTSSRPKLNGVVST